MKLKVCHLTSVHPPFDNRIFHKECKLLAEAGYEVHLVAPHGVDQEIDGIHIHAFAKSYGGRLRRMTLNLFKLYRVAREINANVYHFHDPELIPVGLLLKLHGKKVIFDTHEDVTASIHSKEWINPVLRNIIETIYCLFEQFSVRFFDAVISGHPGSTERIKKSIPVYNYPELKKFRNLKPASFVHQKFLWLGLLSKGRGADRLREAVEKDDRIKIDVIGPVRGIKWKHERINFLGTYPVDEAYEKAMGYLAGLVTFLPEPNNLNSSSNKMYEYMAMGIPVIASDFASRREVIESYNCGLCINPNDPDEIYKAMLYFLENQDEARKMGQNGKKAVLEKYNWEKESKSLLDVYTALCQ